MTEQGAPAEAKDLACPLCGWGWRPNLPPALGEFPILHQCERRQCRKRWVLLVRVEPGAEGFRVSVLEVVRLLGRDAQSVRHSLRLIPQLSDEEVELVAELWTLRPEREGAPRGRLDPKGVARTPKARGS